MEKEIEKLLSCEYSIIYGNFIDIFNTKRGELEIYIYENPSEKLFQLVCYVGQKSDNPELIYFCSMLLATALNYYKNAYKLAYQLALKLLDLQPRDIDSCEWVLFFASIPDIKLDSTDLKNIILHTLKIDKNNLKALALLQERFDTEQKNYILQSL